MAALLLQLPIRDRAAPSRNYVLSQLGQSMCGVILGEMYILETLAKCPRNRSMRIRPLTAEALRFLNACPTIVLNRSGAPIWSQPRTEPRRLGQRNPRRVLTIPIASSAIQVACRCETSIVEPSDK